MNSNISPRAAALLDYISKYESRGNYNAYFRHGSNTEPIGDTIGAVKAFMKKMVSSMKLPSTACGRYQFISPTLISLQNQLKLADDTPWTPDLQDELAVTLLRRRGFDLWANSKMSVVSFANELALEWASLPYYNNDSSYYGKDGLNKALVTRKDFVAAVVAASKLANIVAVPAAPAADKVNEEKNMPNIDTPAKPAADVAAHASDPVSSFLGSVLGGIETKLKDIITSVENGVAQSANVSDVATGAIGSVPTAIDAAKEIGMLVLDVRSGNWRQAGKDVEQVLNDAIAILGKFNIKLDLLTEAVSILTKFTG